MAKAATSRGLLYARFESHWWVTERNANEDSRNACCQFNFGVVQQDNRVERGIWALNLSPGVVGHADTITSVFDISSQLPLT